MTHKNRHCIALSSGWRRGVGGGVGGRHGVVGHKGGVQPAGGGRERELRVRGQHFRWGAAAVGRALHQGEAFTKINISPKIANKIDVR